MRGLKDGNRRSLILKYSISYDVGPVKGYVWVSFLRGGARGLNKEKLSVASLTHSE